MTRSMPVRLWKKADSLKWCIMGHGKTLRDSKEPFWVKEKFLLREVMEVIGFLRIKCEEPPDTLAYLSI